MYTDTVCCWSVCLLACTHQRDYSHTLRQKQGFLNRAQSVLFKVVYIFCPIGPLLLGNILGTILIRQYKREPRSIFKLNISVTRRLFGDVYWSRSEVRHYSVNLSLYAVIASSPPDLWMTIVQPHWSHVGSHTGRHLITGSHGVWIGGGVGEGDIAPAWTAYNQGRPSAIFIPVWWLQLHILLYEFYTHF